MEEKKHVGRPTNEEVASRKKKKVVKVSLITLVCILLLGGVFIFLNRDNIDFSSLMGNSSIKTYKYQVNSTESNGVYYMPVHTGNYKKITKCKVQNSKYVSCKLSNDGYGVILKAKKSGIVKIKIYAVKKNDKTVSITRNIKIGKDFTSPICKISTKTTKINKLEETIVEADVVCNEKVNFTDRGKFNNNKNGFFVYYQSVLNNQNCTKGYYDFIDNVKKINNKTYKLYFKFRQGVCSSNDVRLIINEDTFKDYYGNINIVKFKSNKLSVK